MAPSRKTSNTGKPVSEAKNKKLRNKNERELCEAFLVLKNAREMRRFLYDLCTPQEIMDLADRWWIARIRDEGKSYSDIHEITGVANATIGRVARFLEQEKFQGYRLVIDRIGTSPGSSRTVTRPGRVQPPPLASQNVSAKKLGLARRQKQNKQRKESPSDDRSPRPLGESVADKDQMTGEQDREPADARAEIERE